MQSQRQSVQHRTITQQRQIAAFKQFNSQCRDICYGDTLTRVFLDDIQKILSTQTSQLSTVFYLPKDVQIDYTPTEQQYDQTLPYIFIHCYFINLKHLNLTAVNIGSSESIAWLHAPQLSKLILSKNGLCKLTAIVKTHLKKLETLKSSLNHIKDSQRLSRHFRPESELKSVILDGRYARNILICQNKNNMFKYPIQSVEVAIFRNFGEPAINVGVTLSAAKDRFFYLNDINKKI